MLESIEEGGELGKFLAFEDGIRFEVLKTTRLIPEALSVDPQ